MARKWTRSFLVTIPLTAAPFVWNRITLTQAAVRVPTSTSSLVFPLCFPPPTIFLLFHPGTSFSFPLCLPSLSKREYAARFCIFWPGPDRKSTPKGWNNDWYFLFLSNCYFSCKRFLFFNISTKISSNVSVLEGYGCGMMTDTFEM